MGKGVKNVGRRQCNYHHSNGHGPCRKEESGMALHRVSNCLEGIFSQQRGRINFRQLFLTFSGPPGSVANPGVINVDLSFEENPGVLDWIEIRGVGRMRLERNGISLEEGEHQLCSVYSSIVLLE